MAIIAIFCDGTWNSPKSGAETHVLRLARSCAQTPNQKVLYFAGVGTGTGMVSRLGRWLSKAGGGLFGWGLNRNIRAAYRALCRCYQPGDKIMIFGFSRGAYTARSLAGMVRKCGVLADPSPSQLAQAFRLYRARGAHNAPDTPHVMRQRRRLSPDYATSPADVIWRNDHSYLVRITYLGVWDTVGALGIPASVLGRIADWWNARYAFHDTSLSRLVEAARHAVALDERRVFYEPTLWENLETIEGDAGLNRGDVSDQRPYQQVWFAGNHSIVGGSGAAQALAAAPLLWVWQGAFQCGLRKMVGAQVPHVPVDAGEPAPEMTQVRAIYRLAPWLLRWRDGPAHVGDLHVTARLRAERLATYRPHGLVRLLQRTEKLP